MVLWAKRLGCGGETTKGENRGETTWGKRLGGKSLGGETTCYRPFYARHVPEPGHVINVLQSKMATKMLQLLVFGVLIIHIASSDIFDKILQDVSPCKDVCRNTYTPHTYEKVSE